MCLLPQRGKAILVAYAHFWLYCRDALEYEAGKGRCFEQKNARSPMKGPGK